jgi:hypothetical protein
MAGFANERGEVYFMQMRPGIKSLAPEEENRRFMELNATLVFGACERLSDWGGSVESAIISYEKVTMYLTKFREGVLMLTLEKDEALETIPEVVRSVRSLVQKLA